MNEETLSIDSKTVRKLWENKYISRDTARTLLGHDPVGGEIGNDFYSKALESSRKALNKKSQMEYKTLMGFNEYQQKQLTFLSDASKHDQLINGLLGLAGEVGELCDLFKKHFHHGHELDVEKVRRELGDILWYISSTTDAMGMTLQSVADENIRKLSARYPDGFTVEDSKAKKDER